MCDTCGCNITPGNEHLVAAGGDLARTSTGHESVEVLKGLLDANDHQAGHNREHFARHAALAVNLMSSPGAGKTALLEATVDALGDELRIAVIEGDQFTPDPPSITFRNEGRLISVTENTITVNAVADEAQGRKIVEWIKREINDAWEDRENIKPRYTKAERPQLVEVLKRLPKTNCKKCGAPTCMVFATWVVQGAKDETQCPELSEEDKRKLHEYLTQFSLG